MITQVGAVVVAQLVASTPMTRGLNPVMGKFYLPIVQLKIEKTEIKKMWPGTAHLFKK